MVFLLYSRFLIFFNVIIKLLLFISKWVKYTQIIILIYIIINKKLLLSSIKWILKGIDYWRRLVYNLNRDNDIYSGKVINRGKEKS